MTSFFIAFYLSERGNTQLRSWIDRCTVFYYLGTQLHGDQTIQYGAYGEISATAYMFVQLRMMTRGQPRTCSYLLSML